MGNISRDVVAEVQARTITVAEEQQIQDSSVLALEQQILPRYSMLYNFYYCGLHLCLHGGDEHRILKHVSKTEWTPQERRIKSGNVQAY